MAISQSLYRQLVSLVDFGHCVAGSFNLGGKFIDIDAPLIHCRS